MTGCTASAVSPFSALSFLCSVILLCVSSILLYNRFNCFHLIVENCGPGEAYCGSSSFDRYVDLPSVHSITTIQEMVLTLHNCEGKFRTAEDVGRPKEHCAHAGSKKIQTPGHPWAQNSLKSKELFHK